MNLYATKMNMAEMVTDNPKSAINPLITSIDILLLNFDYLTCYVGNQKLNFDFPQVTRHNNYTTTLHVINVIRSSPVKSLDNIEESICSSSNSFS